MERRFDLVLGSDVLYEARFAEPLAVALDALPTAFLVETTQDRVGRLGDDLGPHVTYVGRGGGLLI